jgi:hypothetical protein
MRHEVVDARAPCPHAADDGTSVPFVLTSVSGGNEASSRNDTTHENHQSNDHQGHDSATGGGAVLVGARKAHDRMKATVITRAGRNHFGGNSGHVVKRYHGALTRSLVFLTAVSSTQRWCCSFLRIVQLAEAFYVVHHLMNPVLRGVNKSRRCHHLHPRSFTSTCYMLPWYSVSWWGQVYIEILNAYFRPTMSQQRTSAGVKPVGRHLDVSSPHRPANCVCGLLCTCPSIIERLHRIWRANPSRSHA